MIFDARAAKHAIQTKNMKTRYTHGIKLRKNSYRMKTVFATGTPKATLLPEPHAFTHVKQRAIIPFLARGQKHTAESDRLTQDLT